MTPIQKAIAVYEQEPCVRSFYEDLALHFEHGYVISTPKAFVMGRPVDRYASEQCILDPSYSFQTQNAWLVWLAAGDLRHVLGLMPFPLPWIGYERNNVLRFVRLERFYEHFALVHRKRDSLLQGWKQSA